MKTIDKSKVHSTKILDVDLYFGKKNYNKKKFNQLAFYPFKISLFLFLLLLYAC